MLPNNPAHYLLFHALLGAPSGGAWLQQASELLLLCSSANSGGDPLIYDASSGAKALESLADLVLDHNREIIAPCDDSVVRPALPGVFIRRARGVAPRAISLPRAGLSVLATGAYLKNTFCLSQAHKAYLSPYLGEQSSVAGCRHFEQNLAQMTSLLGFKAEVLACDLHPDIYSTQVAERLSAERGLPLVKVQHHKAHIAAVMAEHGIEDRVLGLALDGTGLGLDQSAWGGELFVGTAGDLERVGHLSSLPQPGGDRVAKQPWRAAISVLSEVASPQARARIATLCTGEAVQVDTAFRHYLERPESHPRSSSAGRWFDVVASILGLVRNSSFEGQAPMYLEALAACRPLPKALGVIRVDGAGVLDLYPLFEALLIQEDQASAAAFFHAELADGLVRWLASMASLHATKKLVLAGGCFQNALLCRTLMPQLRDQGLQVYLAKRAPCNDAGLSLGQAWYAAEAMRKGLVS